MGYEDTAVFATVLIQEQAAGRTNQVLMEVFHVHISRNLQVPPPLPPAQLLGTPAYQPAQVFAAGTKMQMVILPPPGCTWRHWFSAGMEIELMLMAMLPTVPEFPARMDMSQQ
ncbi:uncharacterized protein [Triticum aestivum]|uniref:uncharacterized protein isoform X3 n=1 Tax=Triticum aestivum TaxID=4565 RepID=UPI001D003057|nr:uncharacterized protein LOC123072889 isoform X3 [Triticum aestivum]